ncbi:hypothetical protein GLOIN_2v1483863 [Rhizophagus irregularis DAOM 181602=DAOM 197198]|uniref:Uncharacterized protein n=1 Tax=Rhizophagus irregularis (strain DAOM 181602 / DAOM 197198 / MUCL 43194) TaxID=747089 RepID=A0A2P4PGJ5_RHIID|nr:hypothetical protein GLOIN_2v1483863 [Rhizophagus irregularis DAOM 181602=DAOM 197198]POG64518.1 hypothetical protein GLOIN_2v1483863 [Rhizophagus irregularis DAOM 181602=DAOM 197198]|eukprot:XP_025171384.1 hypothetical protein GLOIN_2v1483863 [Rhizophagus irregularis DAOM 181602=DAOM 197198]
MLFEIKEPGPGFDYFLNTSCNDWDVVQYHAFWKKSNFGLNKASIMRRFNTQLQKIKEQSTEEEKNNAIRLKKQFQSNCYNDSDVGHGNDNNPFIAQTGGVQRNIRCLSSIMYCNELKPEYVKYSEKIWKEAHLGLRSVQFGSVFTKTETKSK